LSACNSSVTDARGDVLVVLPELAIAAAPVAADPTRPLRITRQHVRDHCGVGSEQLVDRAEIALGQQARALGLVQTSDERDAMTVGAVCSIACSRSNSRRNPVTPV
jgi:hypothetical protein